MPAQILPAWLKMRQQDPNQDMPNPLEQNQQDIVARNIASNAAQDWHPPMALPPEQQMMQPQQLPSMPGNTKMLTAETGSKDITDTNTSRKLPMNSAQYNQLIGMINNSPAAQNEQAAIDNEQGLLTTIAEHRPKAQTDLTALYNFANQLTGGQVKVPPQKKDTAEKWQELLQKYGNDISKRNSELNQLPYKYLNTVYNDTEKQRVLNELFGKESLQSGTKPAGGSGANFGLTPKNVFDMTKKYEDEYSKQMTGLQGVQDSLDQGDVGSFGTALFQAASYIDGASARAMIAAFNSLIPKTVGMDLARIGAYLSSNPNTKVPQQLIDSLRDRLDTARGRAVDSMKNKLETMRQTVSNSPRQQGFNANPIFEPTTKGVDADKEKYKKQPSSTETLNNDLANIIKNYKPKK